MKKFKIILIAAGIIWSFSFVNCYAMEKSNFNSNVLVSRMLEAIDKLRREDEDNKNFVILEPTKILSKGGILEKEIKKLEDENCNLNVKNKDEDIQKLYKLIENKELELKEVNSKLEDCERRLKIEIGDCNFGYVLFIKDLKKENEDLKKQIKKLKEEKENNK